MRCPGILLLLGLLAGQAGRLLAFLLGVAALVLIVSHPDRWWLILLGLFTPLLLARVIESACQGAAAALLKHAAASAPPPAPAEDPLATLAALGAVGAAPPPEDLEALPPEARALVERATTRRH